MTTTVKVEAHCPSDTEVVFGIATLPINGDDQLQDQLSEEIVLKDGEQSQKSVYGDRAAVVFERKTELGG